MMQVEGARLVDDVLVSHTMALPSVDTFWKVVDGCHLLRACRKLGQLQHMREVLHLGLQMAAALALTAAVIGSSP